MSGRSAGGVPFTREAPALTARATCASAGSAPRLPLFDRLHMGHDLAARDEHVGLVLGIAFLEQMLEQGMAFSRQRKREVELDVCVAVGVRDREPVRDGLGAVNVESAWVERLVAAVTQWKRRRMRFA